MENGINCPYCETHLEVSEDNINRRLACPYCNCRFTFDESHNTVLLKAPVEEVAAPQEIEEKIENQTEITEEIEEFEEETSENIEPRVSSSKRNIIATIAAIAIIGIGGFAVYQFVGGGLLSSSSVKKLNINKNTDFFAMEVQNRNELTEIEPKLDLANLENNDPKLLDRYFKQLVLDKTFTTVKFENFAEITKLSKGYDFLGTFLADTDWQNQLWASGPTKNPAKVLFTLALIWEHDKTKQISSNPIFKRLATAIALNSADHSDVSNVEIYKQYMAAWDRQLLHPDFDKHTVRELRFVVDLHKVPAESMNDLVTFHNAPQGSYPHQCWLPGYHLHNIFGDSVHGRFYYGPWNHAYVRHEIARNVGGVCGSLSHYGAAITKAHGLLATPGGQPGHCAFMLRDPNTGRWIIHYSVGYGTGAHYCLWGSSFQHLDMIEAVFADDKKNLLSNQLIWSAESMIERASPRIITSEFTANLYPGKWRKLPDFSKEKSTKTWQTNTINIYEAGLKDHIAITWKGEIKVQKSQELEFSTTSDDGSRLLINNEIVVDNDGVHARKQVVAKKQLEEGKHQLELQFFNLSHGTSMEYNIGTKKIFDPQIDEAFRNAINANPINYAAHLAYAKWLQQLDNVPAIIWEHWADNVATSFKDHHVAAWSLLNEEYINKLATTNKNAAFNQILRAHKKLRQPEIPLAEVFNYTGILEHHMNILGRDKDKAAAIVEVALATQHKTKNYFGNVMKFGSDHLLNDNNYSKKFIDAITEIAMSEGADGDIGKFLGSAIHATAVARNSVTFNQLSELHNRLSPAPELPANYKPKFTEELLSAKGMLTISTTSRWDNPQFYKRIIDNSGGSFNFHTNKETAPWAEVILPGEAILSGIYIKNTEGQNSIRQIPIVAWISEDGKTWTEVFRDTKSRHEYIIDLKGKNIKAKYIKVGRDPGNSNDFFHLRKIQVYGKRLY